MVFRNCLTGLSLLLASLFANASAMFSVARVGQEPPSGGANRQAAPNLDSVKDKIIFLTNEFRRSEMQGNLRKNAALSRAAQNFAEFMARTDKFSHSADGKEPAQRATDAGYEYCLIDENIAYQDSSTGFTTDELARALMEGWKKSPPHRRNLLDPDIGEVGIGVAKSAETGKIFAVQEFGRPRSEAIGFRITNTTDSTVEYTLADKKFRLKPRTIEKHTLCKPEDLKFTGPGEDSLATLRPSNKARYTIVKDAAGRFRIDKE
jgi:uncharacterized protein YkwD